MRPAPRQPRTDELPRQRTRRAILRRGRERDRTRPFRARCSRSRRRAGGRACALRPRKRTLVSTQTNVATTATAVSNASRASCRLVRRTSASRSPRTARCPTRAGRRAGPRRGATTRYVWDRRWSTLHLSAACVSADKRGVADRVLIVDDHPLTRDALAALLAQQGFDVVGEAEDGASAIAAAERAAARSSSCST